MNASYHSGVPAGGFARGIEEAHAARSERCCVRVGRRSNRMAVTARPSGIRHRRSLGAGDEHVVAGGAGRGARPESGGEAAEHGVRQRGQGVHDTSIRITFGEPVAEIPVRVQPCRQALTLSLWAGRGRRPGATGRAARSWCLEHDCRFRSRRGAAATAGPSPPSRADVVAPSDLRSRSFGDGHPGQEARSRGMLPSATSAACHLVPTLFRPSSPPACRSSGNDRSQADAGRVGRNIQFAPRDG